MKNLSLLQFCSACEHASGSHSPGDAPLSWLAEKIHYEQASGERRCGALGGVEEGRPDERAGDGGGDGGRGASCTAADPGTWTWPGPSWRQKQAPALLPANHDQPSILALALAPPHVPLRRRRARRETPEGRPRRRQQRGRRLSGPQRALGRARLGASGRPVCQCRLLQRCLRVRVRGYGFRRRTWCATAADGCSHRNRRRLAGCVVTLAQRLLLLQCQDAGDDLDESPAVGSLLILRSTVVVLG